MKANELTPATEEQIRRATIITGGSLVFTAIRCTLQYIILPFVLPLLGLSDRFSLTLSALLEIVALTAIVYNIRRLWNTDWRWRYLSFSALIIFIILVFMVMDLRLLLTPPA